MDTICHQIKEFNIKKEFNINMFIILYHLQAAAIDVDGGLK